MSPNNKAHPESVEFKRFGRYKVRRTGKWSRAYGNYCYRHEIEIDGEWKTAKQLRVGLWAALCGCRTSEQRARTVEQYVAGSKALFKAMTQAVDLMLEQAEGGGLNHG